MLVAPLLAGEATTVARIRSHDPPERRRGRHARPRRPAGGAARAQTHRRAAESRDLHAVGRVHRPRCRVRNVRVRDVARARRVPRRPHHLRSRTTDCRRSRTSCRFATRSAASSSSPSGCCSTSATWQRTSCRSCRSRSAVMVREDADRHRRRPAAQAIAARRHVERVSGSPRSVSSRSCSPGAASRSACSTPTSINSFSAHRSCRCSPRRSSLAARIAWRSGRRNANAASQRRDSDAPRCRRCARFAITSSSSGYGLNGRNLALALESAQIPYVVLEQNGQTRASRAARAHADLLRRRHATRGAREGRDRARARAGVRDRCAGRGAAWRRGGAPPERRRSASSCARATYPRSRSFAASAPMR